MDELEKATLELRLSEIEDRISILEEVKIIGSGVYLSGTPEYIQKMIAKRKEVKAREGKK